MFSKVNTLRGEAAFGSWLYKVTTNAIMMHFRAEPRGVATGLYFGAERRVWLTKRQLRSFWAHRTARIDTSHR